MKDKTKLILLIAAAVASVFILVAGLLLTIPKYRVWQQGLEGQAKLKRAEQEKLIMIEQARAEKEAAEYRADAIKIVGEMAKEYPEYRIQEFIGAFGEALSNGEVEKIIYVPTEANIPIVEAGRFGRGAR